MRRRFEVFADKFGASRQEYGPICDGSWLLWIVPSWKLTYPLLKALLKMMFLVQWWDMLVSWRVKFDNEHQFIIWPLLFLESGDSQGLTKMWIVMVSVIGRGAQGCPGDLSRFLFWELTAHIVWLQTAATWNLVGKDTGPTLNEDSGTNMFVYHCVYHCISNVHRIFTAYTHTGTYDSSYTHKYTI